MARINAGFGIAFEQQQAAGVLPPGLQDLLTSTPTTIDDDRGAVFGDAESGVGSSGITWQYARNARGPAFVPGTFTRKFDEFVALDLATFTFAWPAAGNKETLTGTPTDAEFRYVQPASPAITPVGIEAILASGGLVSDGELSAGTGWRYKPGLAVQTAAIVWEKQDDPTPKGAAYVFLDCLCDLSLDLTPGGVAIWTATFTGKPDITRKQSYDFPTFNYGQQDQVAAPTVELANNIFGFPRGWSSNTITLGNGIEGTPDSNQTNGSRIEQTTREINTAITIDADDSQPDFDYENLVATVAQTDDQTFRVGALGTANNPATAFAVTMANLNVQEWQPEVPARALSRTLSAFATSDVADSELFFDLV